MAELATDKIIRARIRKNDLVGAIIEFDCEDYYAYGLCTHVHEMMGHLVQLHAGKYPRRPENIVEMMKDTQFLSVFLPLKKAVRYSNVNILDFASLTPAQAKYPRLRSGGGRYKDQKTGEWKTSPYAIVEPDGAYEYVDFNHPDLPYLSDRAITTFGGIKLKYDNNLTPERRFQIAMGTLVLKDEETEK